MENSGEVNQRTFVSFSKESSIVDTDESAECRVRSCSVEGFIPTRLLDSTLQVTLFMDIFTAL